MGLVNDFAITFYTRVTLGEGGLTLTRSQALNGTEFN